MSTSKTQKPSKQLNLISIADGETSYGPQGQRIITVASNELCGSEHMSAGLVVMPPLKVARVHMHYVHESILFFTEGWFATLLGPELRPIFHGPGDVLFIPENIIHVGINLSDTHNAVLLEVRSESDFHDDIIVQTHLEAKVEKIAVDLQKKFAAGELPLPSNWEKRGFGPYQFVEEEQRTPHHAASARSKTKTTVEA